MQRPFLNTELTHGPISLKTPKDTTMKTWI